jgi:hypothetical protein
MYSGGLSLNQLQPDNRANARYMDRVFVVFIGMAC